MKKPLLGQNPDYAKTRTNTDLPGGKPVAKSIFRHFTKGETVTKAETKKADMVRYEATNKVQIRYNADGSIRIELPERGPVGAETIHFSPVTPPN